MRAASIIALAALAILAGSPRPRAQDLVVVGAPDGFAYARGALVAAGTEIRLPPGETLALIDASGKGMTIHGPYDGPIASSAAAGDSATLALVRAILNPPPRISQAVVRGAASAPAPPDADEVDVSAEALQCVAPGHDVTLWRPPPDKATTLILTRLDTNDRAEVAWPSGAATLAWPGKIARIDGGAYLAMLADTRRHVRLVLKFVDFAAPSIAAAKRLADAGCRAQAVTMLLQIAALDAHP
jgi:hypothetical protein